MLVALAAATAGTWGAGPASATAADERCLSAPVPPLTQPTKPLRFGITPLLAGSAGGVQGPVLPEDPVRTAAALDELQPPGRRLVMRINRVFESDGQAGLERAVRLADAYARQGFDVESQVRYHPTASQDGDMAAWEAFVRAAARALAPNAGVVALTITNEVNLPVSPNTSDGAFKDPLDAIVRGTVAARQELDRLGRRDVQLGFSYAYRYLPDRDVAFWKGIGTRATPAFRAATDYVGIQLYPDLFFPPVLAPGQTAGDATLDALALIRGCYMPLAGLGGPVDLWISENGYPTNLGRNEVTQERNLRSTLAAVHAASGTLGVTDYRYFNLRDNRPNGTDLFDDVGLLRVDGTTKPAFAAFRSLVATYGVPAGPTSCRVVLRLPRRPSGVRYRRVRGTVDGTAVLPRLRSRRGTRPTVVLTVPRGRHAVRLVLTRTGGRTDVVVRRTVRCG